MRLSLLVLAVHLATASVASVSSAQASRKAAPTRDFKGFEDELAPKDPPFPWGSLLAGVLLAVAATPLAFRIFRQTEKDLADQRAVGRSGGRQDQG